MFRQLDERHSDGLTVTLEWDATTGEVRVRCEDRHSSEESFSYPVDPENARLAFLHPFALRPSSHELHRPLSSPDPAQGAGANRRRRWLRQGTEAEANELADHTWMWWLPGIGGAADPPESH
jgi:hypothetical protein